MKPSRSDKATAIAVVALLHGVALLCVLQSTRPSMLHLPRIQAAVAPSPASVQVALGAVDAPAPTPVRQRALQRSPTDASTATAQPTQDLAAPTPPAMSAHAPALAPASSPASATTANEAAALTTEVAYLDNPPPVYPAASLRAREQGSVLVSVLVSARGHVEEAGVKESSGSARLDAAALTSVRAWRFVPATRAGVAIEMRTTIPVRFELSAD